MNYLPPSDHLLGTEITGSLDPIQNTGLYLRQIIAAQQVWVGLPDTLRQLVHAPTALIVDHVCAWLPPEVGPRVLEARTLCSGVLTPEELKRDTPLAQSQAAGAITAYYYAAAPVAVQDFPTSLLLVMRHAPFTSEHLAQIQWAAFHLLATPLQLALVQQKTQRYQASMEALHHTSLRISSTLDLQEVLELLVEATLELIPADVAHIFIYHPNEPAAGQIQFGAAAWRPETRPAGFEPREQELPAWLLEGLAQRGEPLFVHNTASQPLFPAASPLAGIEAVAAFPLRRAGRMLGFFTVAFLQPHLFLDEEHYLLSLFADQAAVAIDNAQVAQNLSYRLTEMTTLQHLAQKAGASLDLHEVLQTLVQTIKNLFNTYAVTIMLLNQEQILEVVATAGLSPEVVERAKLRRGQGIGGLVLARQEAIYVPDVLQDERVAPVDPDLRSLLVVPLIVKGRVIGTLSIDSHTPNAFGQDVERFLTIIAAQAAIAIENARLFQNEHRQASELNTLIELSRMVTQHLDLDQVFISAHKAIDHLMPCEAFVISLHDRQTAEVVAHYLIDKGTRYPSMHWPPGAGLSGWLIQSGGGLLVGDVLHEQLPFQPIYFGDKEHVRSLLGVPLRVRDEIIGAISTQSYQPNAFQESDLRLLSSIADHLAMAIEHAYLYADLEKRYDGLQEVERMRLEFTQNVSYELRTPLTFLRAYVDLLLEGEMGELNMKQQECLGIVKNKTAALVHLVEDITTLETSGQAWLALQPLPLPQLAEESVARLAKSAAQKQVRILLEASDPFPDVPGDPTRLAQVFDYLIGNALKYGFPDSLITIRLQAHSDYALVAVNNPGPQIPKAEQARIFERFYQLGNSPTRRHTGIGLGLAIVKHVVESHGGQVWVESEEGAGNTFFFTLPYRSHPFQNPEQSSAK